MIDCSKIENYFAEKRRMTKKTEDGFCCEECTNCPLSSENNGNNISCRIFELYYPKEASKIVQKWSDEHPQKTYLSEFLKHYPNTKLRADGTPESICLQHLGLISKDDCKRYCNCVQCWNQPIEEKSEIK